MESLGAYLFTGAFHFFGAGRRPGSIVIMPRKGPERPHATVLTILTLLILPLTLIAASLVRKATNLYQRIESNQLILEGSFRPSSANCRRGSTISSIASGSLTLL